MLINHQSNEFISKRDAVNLCILLVIALVIGIYLIFTTVVVAKDGVTYINYAKNIEIDPVQAMQQEDQHPGFASVILATNKLLRQFNANNSTFTWIYSAQISALIFRLLSVIVLYFIGKNLVTSKLSFWGVLILLFFPKPAEYGSEALSDWPFFFFFASSLLLLIYASKKRNWLLFAPAGLLAGIGFLFRPEGAQVIIYGGLWLGLQAVTGKGISYRSKSVLTAVLLLLSFLAAATPYMHLKGSIFPKKGVGNFTSADLKAPLLTEAESGDHYVYFAGVAPLKIVKAVGVLLENIGQTVMWFFMPFLFTGIYISFKKPAWKEPETFYMGIFLALNVFLMVWLYSTAGYMSTRHSMPLVMLSSLYIPVGLQIFVQGLKKPLENEKTHVKFISLITLGILICMPNLLRPLHYDKVFIRKAAQWLKENSEECDIIAAVDPRVAFYADRKGIGYDDADALTLAKFVVIPQKRSEAFKSNDQSDHYEEAFSFCWDNRKKRDIIIYEKKM
ncbi:MAG: glycosyltransferase family 39 protein [Sedimentisphaerales bacterium]|nr:glycosyltransferase family 39 protein [Sedimentisphaerales bacterium]